RRHAGDVAEATGRDGFEAVFGFAAASRPQGRAEAHEVPAHLHPGALRDPHVAAFMERHRNQDSESEQHYADNEHHRVGRTSCATACLALLRAQRCASNTSSTVAGSAAHWSAALRTSAIVRTMAGKPVRPARN